MLASALHSYWLTFVNRKEGIESYADYDYLIARFVLALLYFVNVVFDQLAIMITALISCDYDYSLSWEQLYQFLQFFFVALSSASLISNRISLLSSALNGGCYKRR